MAPRWHRTTPPSPDAGAAADEARVDGTPEPFAALIEAPNGAYARRTNRHRDEARAAAGFARTLSRDLDTELRDLEFEMKSLTHDLLALQKATPSEAVPMASEVVCPVPEPEPKAAAWVPAAAPGRDAAVYSLLDQVGHATLFSACAPLVESPAVPRSDREIPGPGPGRVPTEDHTESGPEDADVERTALEAFHCDALDPDGGASPGFTEGGGEPAVSARVPVPRWRAAASGGTAAAADARAEVGDVRMPLGKSLTCTAGRRRMDLYLPFASDSFHRDALDNDGGPSKITDEDLEPAAVSLRSPGEDMTHSAVMSQGAEKEPQTAGCGVPAQLWESAKCTTGVAARADLLMRSPRSSQQRVDLYLPFTSDSFNREPVEASGLTLPSISSGERLPQAIVRQEDFDLRDETASNGTSCDISGSGETATERLTWEALASSAKKDIECDGSEAEDSSPRKWGGC